MLLNPNHSAFPRPETREDGGAEGMTVREHFASLAMAALIPVYLGPAAHRHYGGESGAADIAAEAVTFADALIELLNRPAPAPETPAAVHELDQMD